MTDEELNEIEARASDVLDILMGHAKPGSLASSCISLVAEVRRLREAILVKDEALARVRLLTKRAPTFAALGVIDAALEVKP